MKRVGLNKKMVGIISALLIVIIALIALSSYRDASTILRNQINNYITVKTDYYAQKIISYFEKRDVLLTRETDHVSELISETNGTSSLNQYLATQLNKLKDTYGIVDIYMGYPDGSVVCGTGWVPEDSTWKANERSWYIAAVKNSGNIAYTDVYTDSDTKEPVVTIAKAILDGSGNTIGVVGMDIGLAQLDSLLSSEKLGDTGYPFVLDKDGRFLVHPKYDFQDDVTKADTIYNISNGSLKKIGGQLLSGKSEILRGTFSGVEKVYYSKLIDGTNFYLVSSITYQEMTKELDTMLLHNVIIAIIAIVIAVVALAIYLSKTTNAIKRNVNLLTRLSKGELNLQENDKDIRRKDEIGDILRATVQLKKSLVEIISGVNDTALSVLGACEHLEQVAQETVVTTDGIDKAVEDMASGATSMADITEDAARHTMTMAEDIEEIDHTVQMLLKNTEEMNVTNEMAMKTLEALNTTNEKTKAEIEAIYRQTNETNVFARNINEAANFITAVANETNLLSLNASIEAARAGETGRGFMIVAEQIKKLAEQSHVSAKKIEDSISQLIQGSNNAVNTMHGVKEVVEQQNEKLKETQESFRASYDGFISSVKNIDQIAKDAKNLNEARNNIVDIITNLSAISEENAASTQETSASTTVLTTAVNDVGSEVSVLRQLAEKMVQSISAFKLD